MAENISVPVWDGWETVSIIGRGNFGSVYEIRRDVLGATEKAALKVISLPKSTSDIDELYSDGYDEESIRCTFQEYLEGIVSEYNIMKKMSGSANIVNCEDIKYFPHDDGFGWDIFIKMELLTPLSKALPDHIDEETVINIAEDLCHALELCEKHSIVHRDIKPQNIFLSNNGDYKLGDFGIAKTVEKTAGGTKIGTPPYMAPEVYNNQPYGISADIYSLGLVLYGLLNERRLPFLPLPPETISGNMYENAIIRRFSGESIPAPKNGCDKLKEIVLKACAFKPEDRYGSATEMLNDLSLIKISAHSPETDSDPSPKTDNEPGTKIGSGSKIKPEIKLVIAIVALLSVILAVIAGFSVFNGKDNYEVYSPGLDEVTAEEATSDTAVADFTDSFGVDYVVEQGTSGNWTYRKWASGAAECWGIINITLSKDAYEWGAGIYCASGYGLIPKEIFTAYDSVSVDPIKWYHIDASGRVTAGGTLEGNVFGKGEEMIALKSGDTVKVNCSIKGKWK